MRKIFLLTAVIFAMLTATALASDEIYEYTSPTYGFKITCPAKPIVKVNPFDDPKQKGELLVFAHKDGKIIFGYEILLDAFDNSVPDFNKASRKVIDQYLNGLRGQKIYAYAELENVSKGNRGVLAITAKEIDVLGDNGEVEGKITADRQAAFTFFRTKSGRCISIQLITNDLSKDNLDDYRKSVSTFRD